MTPTIDVVIPIFGGWPLTRSCLTHLRRQSILHNVIVVDNGSPDSSVESIRTDFPEVAVVEMGENAGFAKACNVGVAAGSAPIVVLLNNDVDAEPEMLCWLTAPFADKPRLGSAAPLLTRPNGLIDSIGLCADRTLAGFPRLAGAEPSQDLARAPALLGPSGACGAYRREALEEIGGLDSNIFMYQEDLDLAIRLTSAGWEAAEVPEARGVHQVSATVGVGSRMQRHAAGFSRGYLLRKYGVLKSSAALQTLSIESAVTLADAVRSRDLASLSGRVKGWTFQHISKRSVAPVAGIDNSIGIADSLKMRVAN